MSPAPDTTADRLLCATTARLLQAAAGVAGGIAAACALLAAALLVLPVDAGLPLRLACAGVLLLCPLERVLLLRLRLDAGLFNDLAASPSAMPLALRALDQALATLGLRPTDPTLQTTCPLTDRVAGARRLLLWHAGVVLVQAGAGAGLLVWLALSNGVAIGIAPGGHP